MWYCGCEAGPQNRDAIERRALHGTVEHHHIAFPNRQTLSPCDGLFTRQLQTAIMYAIQYELGMTGRQRQSRPRNKDRATDFRLGATR